LKPNWERPNWKEVKWATIKNLIINYWVIYPLFVLLGVMVSGIGLRFDGFPTHLEILKDFPIILYADDILYMFIHRAFH
jgi:hypothetical protein